MQKYILLLLIMIPNFLIAQFNFNCTTAAYEKQHKLINHADELFFNGDPVKACAMYDVIFSPHKRNKLYGIRQIRCRSLKERPSPQMVEFLYSLWVDKFAINTDTVLRPYLNDILSSMPENPFFGDAYNRLFDSLDVADQGIRFADVPYTEAMRVDFINYARLYQCFCDTGKFISSLGSIMVLIHTLHQHPRDMPFIIGLLNEALLDGNIQPNPYAVILDNTFYRLYGCVLFGVFGSADAPLPTCAGEKVARLYRTSTQLHKSVNFVFLLP